MKKSKKLIFIAFILCFVLASGTIVLASYSTFSVTMPTMGHKTLATGTKDTITNAWSVSLYNTTDKPDSITVWCDDDGSLCTGNLSIKRGETKNSTYSTLPGLNSDMRLRTQPSGAGGWYVRGSVNFN